MPVLSELIESDIEQADFVDENSILSSASDVSDALQTTGENAAIKKSKKRHRVTMPKSKTRTTQSSQAPAVKKPSKTTTKRKVHRDAAATDITTDSQQPSISDKEHDELETEPLSKPKRKPASKKANQVVRSTEDMGAGEDADAELRPVVARSGHAQSVSGSTIAKTAQTGRAPRAAKIQSDADVEAQAGPVDVLQETDDADDLDAQQPPSKRSRTESRTRQDPLNRRRAGSASDTERGDPNLRRRLGDITRKFENVDTKYKNLKEVGVSEATANVEKLRRQCEATTEASNNLISSLKKELAQQAPLVQNARKLKKDLQTHEDEIVKLRSSQAELQASLTTAQNEIKALQAKLAAARTASATAEVPGTKPPGSAIKSTRPVAMVNSEAAHAAQITQMKLDLYGDLTGLIVRSVKHADDGDTYDCIQTGRNGTLHFKLFIDQEDAKTATFEDTEFLYTPLLDANRDRDLIALMPPYLTEDITFARQNAAKFYQRVVDTLTRRPQDG